MRITVYCSSRSLLQVLDGIEQLVLAAVNGQGHGQVRLITGFFMSQADLQVLAGDLKDGDWTIAEAGSPNSAIAAPGAPLTCASPRRTPPPKKMLLGAAG